jgi:DNA repair exonuclease SbcCD ATPase subunit
MYFSILFNGASFMARAGLYKSDVQRARDALLALGRHPSLDAVRVELGNTGSKTTIHKYLKELEAEEGSTARGFSLSDELQALIGGVAQRLQQEADTRIATLQAECTAQIQRQTEVAQELQAQLASSLEQEQVLEQRASAQRRTLDMVKEELQQEAIARHTAEQHVKDLRERLAENEEYRKSLESKHVHARDALEHFRQASKEQREQDQRRHEHQVQQLQAELRQLQQNLAIKQDEITRLNQDGVRLIGDLLHARQALTDAKQAGERREAELTKQMAAAQQQAAAKADVRDLQLTEVRLESAGQSREIKLLQLELDRIRGLYDQLAEEKIIWRHERTQMEDLLSQKERE